MKKLKSNQSTRRLSRYFIIGVTAFASEYVAFLILASIGLPLLASQSLSFLCGLSISFTGNRKVTFNDTQAEYVHGSTSQLWRYAVLAAINLALSNAVIYVLVNGFAAPSFIAKLLVMMMIVLWNYLLFSRFIFQTK